MLEVRKHIIVLNIQGKQTRVRIFVIVSLRLRSCALLRAWLIRVTQMNTFLNCIMWQLFLCRIDCVSSKKKNLLYLFSSAYRTIQNSYNTKRISRVIRASPLITPRRLVQRSYSTFFSTRFLLHLTYFCFATIPWDAFRVAASFGKCLVLTIFVSVNNVESCKTESVFKLPNR